MLTPITNITITTAYDLYTTMVLDATYTIAGQAHTQPLMLTQTDGHWRLTHTTATLDLATMTAVPRSCWSSTDPTRTIQPGQNLTTLTVKEP